MGYQVFCTASDAGLRGGSVDSEDRPTPRVVLVLVKTGLKGSDATNLPPSG